MSSSGNAGRRGLPQRGFPGWVTVLLIVLVVAALIEASIALAVSQGAASSATFFLMAVKDQVVIGNGSAVDSPALAVMASSYKATTVPITDAELQSASYLVPAPISLTGLFVTLFNASVASSSSTDVTATVYRSAAGTQTWTATPITVTQLVEDGVTLYQFSCTCAKQALAAGDRLVTLVVTTDDDATRLVTTNLAASLTFSPS